MGAGMSPDTKGPSRLSVFSVIINVTCGILGTGVLGIPYALAEAGWVWGLTILALVATTQTYTCLTLLKCMERYPDCKTYDDLGYVCMGNVGRYTVMILQAMGNLSCVCLYFIVSSQQLSKLFQHHWNQPPEIWVWIVFAVVYPICLLRTLHEARLVTAVGIVASTIVVAVVVMSDINVKPKHIDFSIRGGANLDFQSFATFTFAYAPHTFLFSVMRGLPEPRVAAGKLGVLVSMVLITVFYVVVSAASYAVYGCHVQDNILLTVPASVWVQVAMGAITLHVVIAIPVYTNECFYSANRFVSALLLPPLPDVEGYAPLATDAQDAECEVRRAEEVEEGPVYSVRDTLQMVVVRTALLLPLALASSYVPLFGAVLVLSGALMVPPCLVFPAYFYLVTWKGELSRSERVLNWFFLVSGLLVSVVTAVVGVLGIANGRARVLEKYPICAAVHK